MCIRDRDIIAELQKPGRDPRESLPPTVLRSDVLEMKDLKPEMELTGTVRNAVSYTHLIQKQEESTQAKRGMVSCGEHPRSDYFRRCVPSSTGADLQQRCV